MSDWFDVSCGLRQGCSLSPILFNLFIDDFALSVKALGKGVDIGNEKVCILLYADDIVLFADNELDLQCMLDLLNSWCKKNHMFVNGEKSQIIHFRARASSRTMFSFTCGNEKLIVTDKYVYLGLTLTEFLDYNITAKMVAQSASRALGLLIAKCKSLGGMPYDVYTKLYDALVWPVIAYGASIWGDRSFSCIDAVQNRAMRFYLGVGKYTPTAAVAGDMGWIPPLTKQWKCTSNLWSRLSFMNTGRINKRIFNYCLNSNNSRCKNWPWRIIKQLNKYDCQSYINVQEPISKIKMIDEVTGKIMTSFRSEWLETINRDTSARSQGGNKLRNYKHIKSSFETESYCKLILPRSHRSAFAKFRAGVAPLRVETGRYEGLPLNARLCPFCFNVVEDEFHALFECGLYSELRIDLFQKAAELDDHFYNYSSREKFVYLFNSPQMIRACAKTCYLLLQRRNLFLYN